MIYYIILTMFHINHDEALRKIKIKIQKEVNSNDRSPFSLHCLGLRLNTFDSSCLTD